MKFSSFVPQVRASTISGIAVMIALGIAGCNSTSAPAPQKKLDYTAVLNKYYEGRPLCLWHDTVVFPVTDASPDQASELGLNALADAGLLTRKPAGKAAPKGAKTFDLTPAGKDALTPDVFKAGGGNFCYGRRKVISIDVDKRNSSTTQLVSYHYGIPQPAAWARNASVETTFPTIPTELASTHAAQVTMLDTVDGWEVSGVPAMLNTEAAATKPQSKIAKALHLKKKK